MDVSRAPELRVVTWNLFHGRDGLPGLGATRRSTWRGLPEDDGAFLHVNRKLTAQMAARIAAWAPDVCALQEVPTAAVRAIARTTGMHAVWTTTGPLVGPARLRDALAARNPDLWRSHEGNANVLLVGPRLRVVERSARAVRLNPVRSILAAAAARRVEGDELPHYLLEPRRLVMVRALAPGGAVVALGCVHCHNGRRAEVAAAEILRAAAALEGLAAGGPAVLAGDLNARPGDPVFTTLAERGWEGARRGGGIGIDRILHRGLDEVAAAMRLAPAEREVGVVWRGRARRVRLSDHDPVAATLRGGAPSTAPASPADPP